MRQSLRDISNVAKPELGSKRQCESCGAKFFDLNRNPITCPKCGTIFQATSPARAQRAAAANDDDEAETDPVAADVVSLEEADDTDAKVAAVAVPDEDIDLGDDDAADDTFLEEEEEENDDVSGLIDGDIETDDEN